MHHCSQFFNLILLFGCDYIEMTDSVLLVFLVWKSDFVSALLAIYQFFHGPLIDKIKLWKWLTDPTFLDWFWMMVRRSTDTRPLLIFQRNIWSLLSQAAGAHVTEYLMNSFSFRQSSSVWHKVSFYPPCLWKWELLVKLGSGDERTAEGRSQITSSDRHIGKKPPENVRKWTDTDFLSFFFFFK